MKQSPFRELNAGEGDKSVTFVLAKEFGFCWGVERSIELAWAARDAYPEKRMHITNELIHNPGVNQLLGGMGIEFMEKDPDAVGGKRFDTVGEGDVVILPAFGASLEEMAARAREAAGAPAARQLPSCLALARTSLAKRKNPAGARRGGAAERLSGCCGAAVCGGAPAALLDSKGVTTVDTTCPWVSKVWTTVDKHQKSEVRAAATRTSPSLRRARRGAAREVACERRGPDLRCTQALCRSPRGARGARTPCPDAAVSLAPDVRLSARAARFR
eukprot:2914542-Prymnesium_polylepis.1